MIDLTNDGKSHIAYLCLQTTYQGQASYAHVHEIIQGLLRRGWSVELFEPAHKKGDSSPGMLRRFWGHLAVQVRFLCSGKRHRVIYIRNHFAAWPTAFFAHIARIPVVQEINGPYEDLFIAWPWTKRFSAFFIWLIRTQLRWADALITVTPGLKEWVKHETGLDSVYVIPNAANMELFRPDAICTRCLPELYLVFFGALARWQGIDTILKAVRASEWPEDLKLVIIGDGVEKSKIETVARYENRLCYLGKLPYRDIAGVVAHSIAGVVPAMGERAITGLSPLKVYETMACGVPVIVTDFPGQADLVRDYECGLVIPPDDPHALAKAAAYLYKNPEIRKAMGRRARQAIEQSHSWDRRAAATEEVLLAVLKKANR